jgi:hypothetical protein
MIVWQFEKLAKIAAGFFELIVLQLRSPRPKVSKVGGL